MKIEIKINEEVLDLSNLSIKDFGEDLIKNKELLAQFELDFSSINKLKGDKDILKVAFYNQLAEEIK